MDIDAIKQKVLEDVDPEVKRQKKKQARKSYIIVTVQFALLIGVIIGIFYLLMGLSTVDGNSMYPTLHDKDTLVYQRSVEEYKVGDVVAVMMPNGDEYVKRVVGVAGDTVNIQEGKVYVNGKEQNLDGPVGETTIEKNEKPNPCRVGDNQVFVLGDNRLNSEDSRNFGPVNIDELRGRLIWYIGKLK
ncbi:MAG: signal peptidase I [Firmicutes bacterium]|nr:signal peptidase I [Bacillota bacterium]